MRIIAFTLLFGILTSCYRTPNLNGESIGSASGAVGGGLLAASQAGGNLIFIGAGTIVGGVVGGIIGSAFDDMNRVPIVDPASWPIVVDCYQTRRPAYIAQYCPGIIAPPQKPNTYQNLPWTDYPTLY
ncbi:MAG: hypothetical protein ACHP6H_01590 [Legionellales bacterium]